MGVQPTETISDCGESLGILLKHLVVADGEDFGCQVEQGLSDLHVGSSLCLESHVIVVRDLVAVLGAILGLGTMIVVELLFRHDGTCGTQQTRMDGTSQVFQPGRNTNVAVKTRERLR